MERSPKPSAETIFNVILLLFSLYILYESFQIGFGTLRRPGSGFFILVCGVMIFGLSTFLLLRGSAQKVQPLFLKEEGRRFLALVVPFLIWILLIDTLGYVLVTFLCTLLLAKLYRLPGLWRPLFFSFCTALLCYAVFDYVLVSDLPRGFWR